jgi:predicted nucleotidyltransferase
VPSINVEPRDLKTVRAILARHVPNRQVRVFGSRVGGSAKPFSDLDLVIMGDDPLPPAVLADLSEDFSESDLSFKVDLVEWASTSPPFREIIEQSFLTL